MPALQIFAASAWCSILDDQEKLDLIDRAYRRQLDTHDERKLSFHEIEWLAKRLSARSHVLVGAAGLGPEVRALLQMGHSVDVLEPQEAGLRACAAITNGIVARATYQDLASAVFDGETEGALDEIVSRTYGAVLLGWGSLSLLLDESTALRVLQACCRLAPHGPILASFLMRYADASRNSLARTLGETVGATAARLLRRNPATGTQAFAMGAWFGICRLYTTADVEGFAAAIGRPLIWEAGQDLYPLVTFLPA